MPSVISDAIEPRTVRPQSVNEPTVRSPILSQCIFSQSQNPEKTPLAFAPGDFDGSFGSQAGAIPGCHNRPEYNQVRKLVGVMGKPPDVNAPSILRCRRNI
jgi:hypothetical protein